MISVFTVIILDSGFIILETGMNCWMIIPICITALSLEILRDYCEFLTHCSFEVLTDPPVNFGDPQTSM